MSALIGKGERLDAGTFQAVEAPDRQVQFFDRHFQHLVLTGLRPFHDGSRSAHGLTQIGE